MIEYIYGSMPGIYFNIYASRPSLVNWEFIQKTVTIMKRIVCIIILNQCSGKKWLLLEAIVDLVHISTYFSGKNVNKMVSKYLDTMLE